MSTKSKYCTALNGSIGKCYNCKKRVVYYPEWVYKRTIYKDRKYIGKVLFCTYGCMRKYDKEKGDD